MKKLVFHLVWKKSRGKLHRYMYAVWSVCLYLSLYKSIKLSPIMRKPVFIVSYIVRLKPACLNFIDN